MTQYGLNRIKEVVRPADYDMHYFCLFNVYESDVDLFIKILSYKPFIPEAVTTLLQVKFLALQIKITPDELWKIVVSVLNIKN